MKTKFLRLFIPITPLFVVTLGLMGIGVYSLVKSFKEQPEYAIYPAVCLVLFGLAVILYFFERRLLQHFAYLKIVLAEVLLGLALYLGLSYSNATTQIQFNTDSDYILVLFDQSDTTGTHFESRGLFSKVLHVSPGHVVHLNPDLVNSRALQIIPPSFWQGVYYKEGNYFAHGDSVSYIYSFNEKRQSADPRDNFRRALPRYVDSLIALELKAPVLNPIQVDVLPDWPKEIEGCSCYFSTNQSAFEAGEYIIVDDYLGTLAVMQLNGQFTQINRITSGPEKSEELLRRVWSGPGVEITLEVRQVSQLDETWQYSGLLILRSDTGTIQKIPVYGECGC